MAIRYLHATGLFFFLKLRFRFDLRPKFAHVAPLHDANLADLDLTINNEAEIRWR